MSKSLGLRLKKNKSKKDQRLDAGLAGVSVDHRSKEVTGLHRIDHNAGGINFPRPSTFQDIPSFTIAPISPADTFKKLQLSIQSNLKKYEEALADCILTQSETSETNYDGFHDIQKTKALTNFNGENQTYFESTNEDILNLALLAHSILEVQIDAHFASYVKPTEKENIVRRHFMRFRDDALNHYRQNMKKVIKDFETREETRNRHEQEKQKAIEYLETHFKLYGWEITAEWRNGLTKQIEQDFGYSSPNSTPMPSAPPATQTLLRTFDIPQAVSNPQANAVSSINVGLYLDEVSITVGEFNSSQHHIIIQELATQVVFNHTEISIGGPIPAVPPRNYFALYSLIKQSSSMHLIFLGSRSMKVSTEEIIAAFFQKLFSRVKSSTGVQNISKVVLSISFLLTSLEKERLKHSLKLAGVHNCRVLSSLITTTVAHAHTINFYPPKSAMTKTILTIQYSDKSFSAALVDIKPESIVATSVTGSENIVGNDGTFVHCHKFMVQNNPRLKQDQSNFVRVTYETAMRELYAGAGSKKPDQIILVKKYRHTCRLDDMIGSITGPGVQLQFINDGPLLGASLLAASALPALVMDASRSDLVLTNKEAQKSTMIRFRNSPFTPREIFPAALTVPPQGFELMLREEFCKDKLKATVGIYKLVPQYAGSTGKAKYSFTVDQDGIFAVISNHPDGVVKRTFGMEGEAEFGLPSWRQLNSFYGNEDL